MAKEKSMIQPRKLKGERNKIGHKDGGLEERFRELCKDDTVINYANTTDQLTDYQNGGLLGNPEASSEK